MRVGVTFGALEFGEDAEWLCFDLTGEPAEVEQLRDQIMANNKPDLQSFESHLEEQFGSMDGCAGDDDLTAYQAHECPEDKQDELIEALRCWVRDVAGTQVGPVYRVVERFA